MKKVMGGIVVKSYVYGLEEKDLVTLFKGETLLIHQGNDTVKIKLIKEKNDDNRQE